MAFEHIQLSPSSTHGPLAKAQVLGLEGSLNGMIGLQQCLQTMIDGDGSQDSHYVEMNARLGTQSDAQARAFWDELNSVLGKLNTDGTVDHVLAAIRQIVAKCK